MKITIYGVWDNLVKGLVSRPFVSSNEFVAQRDFVASVKDMPFVQDCFLARIAEFDDEKIPECVMTGLQALDIAEKSEDNNAQS